MKQQSHRLLECCYLGGDTSSWVEGRVYWSGPASVISTHFATREGPRGTLSHVVFLPFRFRGGFWRGGGSPSSAVVKAVHFAHWEGRLRRGSRHKRPHNRLTHRSCVIKCISAELVSARWRRTTCRRFSDRANCAQSLSLWLLTCEDLLRRPEKRPFRAGGGGEGPRRPPSTAGLTSFHFGGGGTLPSGGQRLPFPTSTQLPTLPSHPPVVTTVPFCDKVGRSASVLLSRTTVQLLTGPVCASGRCQCVMP